MATDGTIPDPRTLLTHSGWVRDLARALVFDPNRVDDVVQETWLAAITQSRDEVRNPRAWLGGIARNVVRETNRSDSRRRGREDRVALEGPSEDCAPAADDLVLRAEQQTRVVQAVLQLAEPYRSTLLMHYFDDLSSAEIGRRSGASDSTVRTRLARGLEQLRERFDTESNGDRRAWCLAMLPLSLPTEGASAAPVAAQAVTSKTGATSMSITPINLAAAVLVTAGIGVGLAAWSPWSSSNEANLSTTMLEQSIDSESNAKLASVERGATAIEDVEQVAKSQRESVTSLTPITKTRVSGVVLGADGEPIAGAQVFVGANKNPFEGGADAKLDGEDDAFEVRRVDPGIRVDPELVDQLRGLGYVSVSEDPMEGRLVECDEEGRFEVELQEPGRVFLAVAQSLGVRPVSGGRRWVESPNEVELRARTIPYSMLSVGVKDVTTGRSIDRFRTKLTRSGPGNSDSRATEDGRIEYVVEFDQGQARDFVMLLEEPVWAAQPRSVRIDPETKLDIEFEVTSGSGLRGRVLDPNGVPLAGAVVYWGDIQRIRRGQFTGRYDPKCVSIDSVETAEDGSYHLPGWSDQVTAWHPKWSARTAPSLDGGELQLRELGSLRGRVLDPDGQPVAGALVAIDHGSHRVMTDADGGYVIEGLAAGAHLVNEMRNRRVHVEIPAGEELNIDPGEALADVTLELQVNGAPFEGELWGLAICRAPVMRVHPFKCMGDGTVRLKKVHVGERVILAAGQDMLVEVAVEGPNEVVELGSADLTLVASPSERIFLVPLDATPVEQRFLSQTIWKLGASPGDDGADAVKFDYVTPGNYRLCDANGLLPQSVLIDGPGTRFELKRR